MDFFSRDNDEREEKKSPDRPADVNSQRSGFAEADIMGPQADTFSSTGSRIDDDLSPVDVDLIRDPGTS